MRKETAALHKVVELSSRLLLVEETLSRLRDSMLSTGSQQVDTISAIVSVRKTIEEVRTQLPDLVIELVRPREKRKRPVVLKT